MRPSMRRPSSTYLIFRPLLHSPRSLGRRRGRACRRGSSQRRKSGWRTCSSRGSSLSRRCEIFPALDPILAERGSLRKPPSVNLPEGYRARRKGSGRGIVSGGQVEGSFQADKEIVLGGPPRPAEVRRGPGEPAWVRCWTGVLAGRSDDVCRGRADRPVGRRRGAASKDGDERSHRDCTQGPRPRQIPSRSKHARLRSRLRSVYGLRPRLDATCNG
ncbi:hypothetical protein M885DRAFT_546977 [Pelagophyceae sp. CCMP2097]|nr:hypothetical protein M885DRAFT_546977 [Pelagophyceae sp. CCMP2097]